METAEHVVESYLRFVKKRATMANDDIMRFLQILEHAGFLSFQDGGP